MRQCGGAEDGALDRRGPFRYPVSLFNYVPRKEAARMAETHSGRETSRLLDGIIERKSRESVPGMVLLGMLAGVYIGFGAIAATTVSAFGGLPVGITRLLAGSVFCVGLVLVIIPGSELFTGNILMAAGLVSGKVGLARVLRNWLFVYSGNFAGAVLLALVMAGTGLLDGDSAVGRNAAAIATAKIALPFGQALLRGVLCNMLVCLAVIITIAARTASGKILGIYFPITVFVMCGFEHSIANMYFLPAGLLARGAFASEFWTMFRNLIPVTIGNIVGGLLVIVLHPARARKLAKSFGPGPESGGE
jgi:formate/nitrite transporter